MSNGGASDGPESNDPPNGDAPDDQLLPAFTVSSRMRPYMRRLRLRLADYDQSDAAGTVHRARLDEMRAILIKKKIPPEVAEQAITRTLDAASDHQLNSPRRTLNNRDLVRQAKDLQKLILRLERLGEAISKLPLVARGKLNEIVTAHAKQPFDTETFASIIAAVMDALPELSPKRHADEAAQAINTPLSVSGVRQTSPLDLVDLWETISPVTRTSVERRIGSLAKSWSMVALLKNLIGGLTVESPRKVTGRPRGVELLYIRQVAQIWRKLGLKAGLVNGSANSESAFQRFCRLGLMAIGDVKTPISATQIRHLKRFSKRRRPYGS